MTGDDAGGDKGGARHGRVDGARRMSLIAHIPRRLTRSTSRCRACRARSSNNPPAASRTRQAPVRCIKCGRSRWLVGGWSWTGAGTMLAEEAPSTELMTLAWSAVDAVPTWTENPLPPSAAMTMTASAHSPASRTRWARRSREAGKAADIAHTRTLNRAAYAPPPSPPLSRSRTREGVARVRSIRAGASPRQRARTRLRAARSDPGTALCSDAAQVLPVASADVASVGPRGDAAQGDGPVGPGHRGERSSHDEGRSRRTARPGLPGLRPQACRMLDGKSSWTRS